MASSGQHFRRAHRMRRARDFRLASREGKRLASRSFIILLHPASPPRLRGASLAQRLGLTVSRKVGNAVTRNRVKRSIREWFRTHRDELPSGGDVLVIARPSARQLSTCEIVAELTALVARESSGPAS